MRWTSSGLTSKPLLTRTLLAIRSELSCLHPCQAILVERQDDLRGLFADLEAKYGVHFLDIEKKRNNAKVSYLLGMYADRNGVVSHAPYRCDTRTAKKLTVSKYSYD